MLPAAQILKADGVARQAELQEQLERVKAENAQLKSCLSDAARVHAFEVESLRTDMDSVYNAVGSVGRDMSRSSDEQGKKNRHAVTLSLTSPEKAVSMNSPAIVFAVRLPLKDKPQNQRNNPMDSGSYYECSLNTTTRQVYN